MDDTTEKTASTPRQTSDITVAPDGVLRFSFSPQEVDILIRKFMTEKRVGVKHYFEPAPTKKETGTSKEGGK